MRAPIRLAFLLLCSLVTAHGFDRTFTIVTNTAMVNHWPAADAFIGTSDDVVSALLSKDANSTPNVYGSYSYIATDLNFYPGAPDPLLFGTNNAITFVLGSATIDTSAFVTNDVPLLKAVQFSGTELFPGHGAYTVKLTSRHGGTYSHQGNVFTFSSQYDFVGTFVAGTAVASNATAQATIAYLELTQFDNPDLTAMEPDAAAYVRNVAIPVAKSMGAGALICGKTYVNTTGSVPGGGTGFFPPLQGHGVVLALDLPVDGGHIEINGLQLTPDGPRLQWTPVGSTFSVLAADAVNGSFLPLATGLTQAQYTDTSASGHRARYYRVSSP